MPRFLSRTPLLIYRLALFLVLCAINPGYAAGEGKLNYQQARKALSHAEPQQRINGMNQLLKLGTAKDASLVYALLDDAEPSVRQVALGTVWQLWGKSGNAAIDKLYQKGLDHMQDGDIPKAIQVFSTIIAKRPEFAEGWNKRATVYYMSGQ